MREYEYDCPHCGVPAGYYCITENGSRRSPTPLRERGQGVQKELTGAGIRENPKRSVTTAERADPALWEAVKREVTAGSKGGVRGEWSARKAQLAVAIYKKRGGGYVGPKSPHNSLTKWTQEDWRTRSGEPSLVTGERYLPARAIAALTPAEYAATSRAKRAGLLRDEQSTPQPTRIAAKTVRYRQNPDGPKTGAFRRWFGNSQVVDNTGAPLVVYHGTPDARLLFLPAVSGNGKPGFYSMLRGATFFATDSIRVADTYAAGRRAFDHQNAEPMVIPLYLRIENPKVLHAHGRRWKDTERHVEEARVAGHDGVIIHSSLDDYNTTHTAKPSTVYVFFSSHQAKSAQEGVPRSSVDRLPLPWAGSNDGSFDLDDPDLRQ